MFGFFKTKPQYEFNTEEEWKLFLMSKISAIVESTKEYPIIEDLSFESNIKLAVFIDSQILKKLGHYDAFVYLVELFAMTAEKNEITSDGKQYAITTTEDFTDLSVYLDKMINGGYQQFSSHVFEIFEQKERAGAFPLEGMKVAHVYDSSLKRYKKQIGSNV